MYNFKTKKEMKKNLFMVAAVALMALVSCNKEEINNGLQEPASDIVFVAEFEQEADTKIALGEKVDGVRKTTWVAGDQIKINGTVFSAQADGASTAFKTTEAFDETAKTFRAVYPASSYISTAAVDIPASQNGTFAGASIAVAESSTTSLKFNNLVTILKFQVPVNCSKVTFESTASIAGRITVNYNGGVITPNYAEVTQPNKTINVTGTFVPGTDYYVAVKPGTHTFTVKIDGNVSKESTKAVTVERSKILNMGVLPEPKESAVIRINNMNGWPSLNITIKDGNTTLANGAEMANEGSNVFSYELDPKYIGKSVSYYITYDWYQTSTKTVTLAADSEAEAIVLNTTYLQPNSRWNSDSPRFGAHMWVTGKSGIWVMAKKVKDNFFEVEIPTNAAYNNIIWCRMNPNNSINDWSAVWNQTSDLTLKHICYCLYGNDDDWNKSKLNNTRWY